MSSSRSSASRPLHMISMKMCRQPQKFHDSAAPSPAEYYPHTVSRHEPLNPKVKPISGSASCQSCWTVPIRRSAPRFMGKAVRKTVVSRIPSASIRVQQRFQAGTKWPIANKRSSADEHRWTQILALQHFPGGGLHGLHQLARFQNRGVTAPAQDPALHFSQAGQGHFQFHSPRPSSCAAFATDAISFRGCNRRRAA